MWWFFSMHKEAYFVLDLNVTLTVLTLLFSLCFFNFPMIIEENYVLGCNTSGREVTKIRAADLCAKRSLCTTFHYGKFLVSPPCILAWESLISSLHTLPLLLSPKHWVTEVLWDFTRRMSQAVEVHLQDFCLHSLQFLLFWIWKTLSKLLSAVSQSLALQAGDQLCEPLAVPSGVQQLQRSPSRRRRWWHWSFCVSLLVHFNPSLPWFNGTHFWW